MERKVYVERKLIDVIGWEYFEGLRARDLTFAKEGYQVDGIYLEISDNGDYYLSSNEEGGEVYVEI